MLDVETGEERGSGIVCGHESIGEIFAIMERGIGKGCSMEVKYRVVEE